MKENMNFGVELLEQYAISSESLAAQEFIDIATSCDCPMEDSTPRTVMQDEFPLVTWLLNTPMSRTVRRRFNLDHVKKNNGVWEMDIPGTFWTTAPEDTGEECCWVPLKFDKCCSKTPLNLLCLKDCGSVYDYLVKRDLDVTSRTAMQGIARAGESVETVEDRINRLSFMFFQAKTIILGMDNVYANPLKPFHGLMQVMENPAIQTLYAFDIIGAFEELGCRLDILGYSDGFRFATNPIIRNSIDAVVTRGQNGQYPEGWSKENGLRYKGIPFIADKTMPVDLTTMTGEVWLLDGNSTGVFMASNLMVSDRYVKRSGVDTSVDNCGAECKYYYNYGGAFANNANRMAKLVGVPINTACNNVIGDLEGLIVPQTLIPSGALEA